MENKKIKGKSEIALSLYEMNQNIISQLPSYDKIKIQDLQNRLNQFDEKYKDSNYFMFLCRQKNYYTVFKREKPVNEQFASLGESVITIIQEMNKYIATDEDANDHYEIWLRDEEGVEDYLLFPYDDGVVTYGI